MLRGARGESVSEKEQYLLLHGGVHACRESTPRPRLALLGCGAWHRQQSALTVNVPQRWMCLDFTVGDIRFRAAPTPLDTRCFGSAALYGALDSIPVPRPCQPAPLVHAQVTLLHRRARYDQREAHVRCFLDSAFVSFCGIALRPSSPSNATPWLFAIVHDLRSPHDIDHAHMP
ncbi:hypothetical protein P153DRAFT_387475 [Dothidotthia symphoricarpi CBS 119687]|uniref:Uncharacterized protein n=1 Tax=Dothidotthia symphoricarpi CBS 119687 TaxID=1392245 RepID=A0A6A6A6V0_9PLEO|nr:uncharacterized protein P153DRAFT_387475 [Dothidotthia symphoricarpi CBS 119687]KAF2127742.1 hypothetical protein P153DRAFT_387475 [Dothidotthia symphoricarpi CBS 119687]